MDVGPNEGPPAEGTMPHKSFKAALSSTNSTLSSAITKFEARVSLVCSSIDGDEGEEGKSSLSPVTSLFITLNADMVNAINVEKNHLKDTAIFLAASNINFC